jgi:hypothetical protein
MAGVVAAASHCGKDLESKDGWTPFDPKFHLFAVRRTVVQHHVEQRRVDVQVAMGVAVNR